MSLVNVLEEYHNMCNEKNIEENIPSNKCRNIVVHKGRDFYIDDESLSYLQTTYSNVNRYKWKKIESDDDDASVSQWEVKDYGPQVSWRTVYIVEYFGALVALPVVMWVQNPFNLLRMDVVLWVVHYGLRLYESVFVHTFSSETMPFKNIFKNSAYYWGAGALIGYFGSQTEEQFVEPYTNILVVLWCLCHMGTVNCHLYLANLRNNTNGDKKEDNGETKALTHILPTNWMFRLVVCPNYGFEIVGWVLYAMLTNPFYNYNKNTHFHIETNDFVYFFVKLGFCLIGAVQMFLWSIGKKKRYKKLFDDKYKVKNLLFPFIL